ncbi:MAG: response regulator, partial [Pseudomonadota bacterium]
MGTQSKNMSDKNRIACLETRIRHLSNELRLTKEEYETSQQSLFDIFSNMERQVQERTRDIKALKKVLELKGRELQLMLDSAPGMIFYKDVAQRYIRVNWKFAECLGIPIPQVSGKTHGELFPDGTAEILSGDSEVISTGEPVLNRTGIVKTVQGQMPVLVNMIPHKDIDGNVIGIVGFTTDLTDLRRAEEEKENLISRIARAEKMESIGTLAGGIAHDFNNLLFAIQGNVSLIQLAVESKSIEAGYLDSIAELVQSGASLTRQLLGFARAGKYEAKPTDLNRTVKVILEMFSRTRKDITIHKDFEQGNCIANIDRGQIEQVMLNIFVNASHAMPGGGTIFVSTHKGVLISGDDAPKAAGGQQFVEIRIRDTGIGIDESTRKRIFEPFFTTKTRGRGTGLGLASAYGIIKNHRGLIRVESVPGSGSTFAVFLPESEVTECAGEAAQIRGVVSGSGRILLVDDEASVREVAEAMIKQLGYSVQAVKDGKEALRIYQLESGNFDLIILDMIMPGMSGNDVYKAIKAINPSARVLLSSGYSLDSQAQDIMAQGCGGFIQKPFDLS